MFSDNYLKKNFICLVILVTFLGFYLLYIGDFIFVPVIISIFAIILFSWIYDFFFRFIKNKPLSVFATFWTFALFFIIVGYIITTQVDSFIRNSGKFQEWIWNIIIFIESIWNNFWIEIREYLNLDILKKIDFKTILQKIYSWISGFSSSFLTTLVILLFLFLERKSFRQKARVLFDSKGRSKLENIYTWVTNDLNLYFSTKFLLALTNWIVATIIMWLFGLDFALIFGLLVFILDFIPIVWALIALWLPFLYSLVTFWNVWASFLLLLCLYIPQVITWNIIEPKIMWERLNLSSFVLVLSLLFWVQLWWIIWAFLAIPIMATLNVIFSKFEATKFISVLIWWKTKK